MENEMIFEDEMVLDIGQDISGMEFYLVGGAVRDSLMGIEPKDYDFVVVGEDEGSMVKRDFMPIMAEFPIFLDDNDNEWALARTEEKTGEGYKGFEVYSDPDVTLEEDLERRDFTINAMAYNPHSESVIDPYNGKKDIERETIRHVSDAFAEDPLRVLRACEFASRFDFIIAEETVELCKEIAPELETIPGERIGMEVHKAMKNKHPSKFWIMTHETDALKVIFPELEDMMNIPAGPPHYHYEDAFEHTMMVLEDLNEENGIVKLMGLFHDIGKIKTPKDELPHHYEHPKHGQEIAEEVADRWKLSNMLKDTILTATTEHGRFRKIPDMKKTGKIVSFVEKLQRHKNPNIVDEMQKLVLSDKQGRIPPDNINTEEIGDIISTAEQVIEDIKGRHILEEHDVEPGEKVGHILHQKRAESLRSRLF